MSYYRLFIYDPNKQCVPYLRRADYMHKLWEETKNIYPFKWSEPEFIDRFVGWYHKCPFHNWAKYGVTNTQQIRTKEQLPILL